MEVSMNYLLIIIWPFVVIIGVIVWKNGYYKKFLAQLDDIINYVEHINKWKDNWLESRIKTYADDVRRRYNCRPPDLNWAEKIIAPIISRNYTGTVANLISVIRILLAVIIFLTLRIAWHVGRELSMILAALTLMLFIIAGLLDLLDGPAARALKQESGTGKILDPAADKLLLASVLIVLGFIYLPPLTCWVVIGQETFLSIITFLKMIASKLPFTMDSQANMAGKIKNIFELVAGGLLFFCPFGGPFAAITNVLFIISIPLAMGSIIGYISSVKRKEKKS
jgi:CDP-diacylglycerol--glycerol-3-phosphate 3-phosphatidyltransferase